MRLPTSNGWLPASGRGTPANEAAAVPGETMSGISQAFFARLMAQLSPFEGTLAIAVSGGRDSMALCLLADGWARAQGHRIVALTVDHGLRDGSADEALRVGQWLSNQRIEHHVLRWTGPKPKTRIQEKAREARYELLTGWCRENGVGDLALAHQLEDQAETFVMRLRRGSGPDGLAGMSAIVERGGVRIVRPLLGVSRSALAMTLEEHDQEWLDDPSNRNRAFERVRIRESISTLAGAGYPPEDLSRTAAAFGHLRILAETQTQALLGGACRVHGAGYAEINMEVLATAPRLIAMRALACVAACIGSAAYRADRRKLSSLYDWVCDRREGKSFCLARCRFQKSKNGLIVSRENRGLPKQRLGNEILWDGRFRLQTNVIGAEYVMVGPLGRDGWAEVVAADAGVRETCIPYPARLVLPAIRDFRGVREVPHISFRRPGIGQQTIIQRVEFSPRNKLSAQGFCLAPKVSCTIS